jgi:hypothetical protein
MKRLLGSPSIPLVRGEMMIFLRSTLVGINIIEIRMASAISSGLV